MEDIVVVRGEGWGCSGRRRVKRVAILWWVVDGCIFSFVGTSFEV